MANLYVLPFIPKGGAYYTENSSIKYNFKVFGYTPEITTWQ
jgi:hypothetical protein